MYLHRCILLLTAGLFCSLATPQDHPAPQLSATTTADPGMKIGIYNEDECLRAGGVCMLKEECPEGLLANAAGLCPTQQSRRVECCHGVSKKEKRCQYLGGECFSECKQELRLKRAKDCKAQEYCCLLT